MRALLLILALGACIPDLTGIPALSPCTEEPAEWTDAQWQAFYTAPTPTILDAWVKDARCQVHLLRALGRSLTIDDAPAAGELQARGAEMQQQAKSLKVHLLKMQASTWRLCACEPTPSCEHIDDLSGDAATIDPLCDGTRDRSQTLVTILDHMIDHAQRAARESGEAGAKAHGEHVLNCIQSGGEEDWDLDANPQQVCGNELNDYGLVGGGPGDLIQVQFDQVQRYLLP